MGKISYKHRRLVITGEIRKEKDYTGTENSIMIAEVTRVYLTTCLTAPCSTRCLTTMIDRRRETAIR